MATPLAGPVHDRPGHRQTAISQSAIGVVLAALEAKGCRPVGTSGRWRAKCPVHSDRKPSLSITEGSDGRVLLFCHAGCPTVDILAALHLTWGDLAPPQRGGENGRTAAREQRPTGSGSGGWPSEEAAFDWLRRKTGAPKVMAEGLGVRYRDGALTLTWPGVSARMVRPGPGGPWRWEAEGHESRRPDLWPLPIFPARTVWVAEGATDALALRAAGLPAYASVKGAARDLGLTFRALQEAGVEAVVLVFDLDQAGRDGANKAARAAQAAGLRAQVLAPPTSLALAGGKDICDWLAMLGGDPGRLRQAVEALAQQVTGCAEIRGSLLPTKDMAVGSKLLAAADILAAPTAEALESLPLLGVDGVIIRGWSHLVAAPPKCGKTELIWACVREWDSLGVRVLLVTEETEHVWAERLRRDNAAPTNVRFLMAAGVRPEEILSALREAAPSFDVVIVDTLRHLFQVDEGDNAVIAATIGALDDAIGRGKTRIYLHHTRKAPGQHGERTAGGLAFVGAVDRQLELTWDEHDDDRRLLKGVSRIVPVHELLLGWRDGQLHALGDPRAVALAQLRDRVLGVLDYDWRTTAQVMEDLGEPKPSGDQVRAALKGLAQAGIIERDPPIAEGEKRGRVYRWRLVLEFTSDGNIISRKETGGGWRLVPEFTSDGTSYSRKETWSSERNYSPAQASTAEGGEREDEEAVTGALSGRGAPGGRAGGVTLAMLQEAGFEPEPAAGILRDGAGGVEEAGTGDRPTTIIEESAEAEAPLPPSAPPTATDGEQEAESVPPHPISRSCPSCQPAPSPWWQWGYQYCARASVLIRNIAKSEQHLLRHVPGHKGGPWVSIADELLKATHPRWLIVRIKGYGDGWLDLEAHPGVEVNYGEPQLTWRLCEFTWAGRQAEFPHGISAQDFPHEGISARSPGGREFLNMGGEFPHAEGISEHGPEEFPHACAGCGQPLPARPGRGRPPRWCSNICRMRTTRGRWRR